MGSAPGRRSRRRSQVQSRKRRKIEKRAAERDRVGWAGQGRAWDTGGQCPAANYFYISAVPPGVAWGACGGGGRCAQTMS